MNRYFVRPRAAISPKLAWDDPFPLIPNIEVADHEPTFTGLFDANGDDIMRAPRGIGFHAEI